MAKTSDETTWRQRLFNHIYESIAPLVPDSPCSRLHQATLQTLRSHFAHFPLHYDILNVQQLLRSFKSSYQVDLISKTANSVEDLPGLPVVVLGVLIPNNKSDSHGELLLRDTTGDIICEVTHTALSTYRCIGSVVLLLSWRFIYCKSSRYDSYLEVQKLHPLIEQEVALPPHLTEDALLSVSDFQQYVRRKDKPKKAKLNVYGRITAVSEVQRNGDDCLLLVQLTDTEDATVSCGIIIQVLHLLYWVKLLQMSQVYIFSELRDMVMSKGTPIERRVLASSNQTQVYHHSTLKLSPSSSGDSDTSGGNPPSKRVKRSETPSTSSSMTPCEHKDEYLQLQGEHQQSIPLVAYRGIVTSCISPEFGVYELDGKVWLYLTHQECLDLCRGVRKGALLELHNVHVMRIAEAHFKHRSGFYCCPLSTVRVIEFSKLDSPFKGFYGNSRLASLAKKHNAMDVVWMVGIYHSLQQKHKQDLKTCVSFIEEIPKLSKLSELELVQDMSSDFFCRPHHCKLLQQVDLSSRPRIPTLEEFTGYIHQRVDTGEMSWWASEGGGGASSAAIEASPFLTYLTSAHWSFTSMKSTELTHPQLLTGSLRGSNKTGYMELADSTASIPVVCCMPSTSVGGSDYPVMHYGSKVLIDEFVVFVERTTESSNTETSVYLYAKQCRFVINGESEVKSSDIGDGSRSIVSKAKPLTESSPPEHSLPGPSLPQPSSGPLYLNVLNKNGLVTHVMSRVSKTPSHLFTVQAVVHTDTDALLHQHKGQTADVSKPPVKIALEFPSNATKWYSYIYNGHLYSLSTSSKKRLPSLVQLKKEPCIVIEEEMELKLLELLPQPFDGCPPILAVSNIMDNLFLPKFDTISGTQEDANTRSEHELVSFTGVILQHSYRINHEALASGSLFQGPSSKAGATENIVALTVQSLQYPDTIVVYYHFKEGIPLPIGLLPGGVVTLHALRVKSSKSGNVYCINSASSSITVNSLEGVGIDVQKLTFSAGVMPQMLNLSTTCLYGLMQDLIHGCLSRRVVCVRGRFMSVQQAAIQFTCRGCHCTVVDGSCMTSCLQSKPVLKAEARLIIDDGSTEGHVYVKDNLLQQALGMSITEWSNLLGLVEKTGVITYNRVGATPLQVEGLRLSFKERAQQKLAELASHFPLRTTMNVYCQPFISSAEVRGSVIGQKSHMIRISSGGGTEYSTLALPRLQLRALAIAPVNCARDCIKLMEQLLEHEQDD